MGKCVIGISLILVALTTSAQAATWYVSNAGNDGNSCTTAQTCTSASCTTAKATPNAAGLCAAQAGGAPHTIFLRDGVYPPGISFPGGTTMPVGSSFAAPITFAGFPGETAIVPGGIYINGEALPTPTFLIFDNLTIDCQGVSGDGVLVGNAHNIRFQNGVIKNCGRNGVHTTLPGSGFEILTSQVYNNGSDFWEHGIYISSPNALVDGNEVFDNGAYGLHFHHSSIANALDNLIARNNRVYRNGYQGLELRSGTNALLYNNLIYDNGFGRPYTGVPSAGDSGGGTIGVNLPNGRLFNNTFYANANNKALQTHPNQQDGVQFRNNIFAQNELRDDGGAAVYQTNLCTTAGPACALVGNPRFVNPAAGNFAVQNDSPAINSGATMAVVPTDITGMARPQGPAYDVGAYEYVAVTPVATALQFVQQPTHTLEDTTMTPAVTVRIVDQFGVTFASTASVGLSIGTNPSAGTLTGGAPVAAVAGLATFAGLNITNPGVGYTLVAASTGLTSATSTAFAITALPPPSTELVLFLTTGGFLSP